MTAQTEQRMAFERPGGETCGRRSSRPIDLAHLSRQTMGDRALEQEVLGLFLQQAILVKEQIAAADTKERLRLAHSLKGSARGVGAFALGDCAAEIESRPADKAVVGRLTRLIDELRDFIAAIGR
ncbi:MAG: Hpt domain-containing protein [Rhizobiaceae bacterium]|nr:Hpt domain-containing protein [Rhizobiaceae bacterium]